MLQPDGRCAANPREGDTVAEQDNAAGGSRREPTAAAGREAAANDFAAASTGSGWQYDSEAMKNVIGKLTSVRDGKLQQMAQRTDELVGIDPPGAEPVSEGYTKLANTSGESHNTQFQRYRDYLTGYIETLEKIDTAYRKQDEATLESLRKLGLGETDA